MINRNLRTYITDKEGYFNHTYDNGVTIKWRFRPFLDLLQGQEFIKERKLPDGRTKYYIRTNVRK
jgi:hypothetical protein